MTFEVMMFLFQAVLSGYFLVVFAITSIKFDAISASIALKANFPVSSLLHSLLIDWKTSAEITASRKAFEIIL